MNSARSDKNQLSKKEILIVVLSSFLIVMGFCAIMGTLTSGYHPVDDHEYLEWTYDRLHGVSFMKLMLGNIEDNGNRFRPLYQIFRTIWVELFGTNIFIHSIVKAMQASICLACLYFVARRHNYYDCGRLVSVLFAITAFVGYQSSVWWKLGTTEVQGCLLFSIGFLFTEAYLRYDKNRYLAGAIISYGLLVLLKENLFILLPFVGFYTLFYDLRSALEHDHRTKITWKLIFDHIRRRIVFYIFLIGFFLATAFICCFVIDPNAYKGGEYLFGHFDKAAWLNSMHDLKWFVLCGCLFTAVLLTFYDHFKYMWMDAILLFIFVFPQILVYSHSGMDERYIIPSSIGYALFFVISGFGQKVLYGFRKYIYIAGMLILVVFHVRAAVLQADYFTYRGKGFQATMDLAADLARENPDAKICSALEYFEPNKTIEFYLMLNSNDNMYYCHNIDSEDLYIDRKYDGDYSLSHDDGIYTDEPMDIVIAYSPDDIHYSREFKADPDKYEMIRYGTMCIYVRKDSGITVPDPGIASPRFYQL